MYNCRFLHQIELMESMLETIFLSACIKEKALNVLLSNFKYYKILESSLESKRAEPTAIF